MQKWFPRLSDWVFEVCWTAGLVHIIQLLLYVFEWPFFSMSNMTTNVLRVQKPTYTVKNLEDEHMGPECLAGKYYEEKNQNQNHCLVRISKWVVGFHSFLTGHANIRLAPSDKHSTMHEAVQDYNVPHNLSFWKLGIINSVFRVIFLCYTLSHRNVLKFDNNENSTSVNVVGRLTILGKSVV